MGLTALRCLKGSRVGLHVLSLALHQCSTFSSSADGQLVWFLGVNSLQISSSPGNGLGISRVTYTSHGRPCGCSCSMLVQTVYLIRHTRTKVRVGIVLSHALRVTSKVPRLLAAMGNCRAASNQKHQSHGILQKFHSLFIDRCSLSSACAVKVAARSQYHLMRLMLARRQRTVLERLIPQCSYSPGTVPVLHSLWTEDVL